MEEPTGEIRFEHDVERGQFDAILGEHRALITYRSNREGKIFLVHTESDEALKNTGVTEKLVLHVFDHIRENGMRMIPVCPYIKTYLKRNSEHMDIVVSGLSL
jgi:predicted GNAT family acetyltransferase